MSRKKVLPNLDLIKIEELTLDELKNLITQIYNFLERVKDYGVEFPIEIFLNQNRIKELTLSPSKPRTIQQDLSDESTIDINLSIIDPDSITAESLSRQLYPNGGSIHDHGGLDSYTRIEEE